MFKKLSMSCYLNFCRLHSTIKIENFAKKAHSRPVLNINIASLKLKALKTVVKDSLPV